MYVWGQFLNGFSSSDSDLLTITENEQTPLNKTKQKAVQCSLYFVAIFTVTYRVFHIYYEPVSPALPILDQKLCVFNLL